MNPQTEQPFANELFVLKLLPQKLPGQVIGRKSGITLKIKTLVNALPIEDGTYATEFFAPKGGADIDDYVLFQWQAIGERGYDYVRKEPGDPTAIQVEVITEDIANSLAEEIRQTISSGLREKLKKQLAEIEIKEGEIDNLVSKQVQEKITEIEQKDYELEQRKLEIDKELKRQQETIAYRSAELEAAAESVKYAKAELEQTLQDIEPYRQAIPDLLTATVALPTKRVPIPQDLAKRWKDALHNNGLVLPEALATSYLIALFSAFYSGSLVLLNGPVGVGKTSIVKQSATILNGKNKVIPVRPAWLDPSDLLGYFDPIKEVFRPSSFLNALKDAKAHSDNLYLICLDELNLAKIENYGADLLSSLEYSSPSHSASETQGEQQGLLLYSESIEKDLWEEARNLNEKVDRSDQESARLQQINALLKSYPANFHIASNTAILGTLNSDETTYDLSPKIIDRAYVVTYPVADLALQLSSQSPALTQTLNISVSVLTNSIRERLKDSLKTELPSAEQSQLAAIAEGMTSGWQNVVQWNSFLSGLCIPLGHRTKRDFRTVYAVCSLLGLSHQDCMGHFLFLKLLPRISFLKSTDTQASFSQLLERIKKDFKEAGTELKKYDPGDILPQLEKQAGDSRRQYVRYWVRL